MSETRPDPTLIPAPIPIADASRLVLDADQIARACARMAHQILEANRGAEGLVLLGHPDPRRDRWPAGWPRRWPTVEGTDDPGRRAGRDHVPRRPAPPADPGRRAHRGAGRGRRRASWCWSTTCSTPAVRSGPRWTPSATSVGRGPSGWPCWSTAGTGSCRSAPTTSGKNLPTAAGERVRVRLAEIDGVNEVTICPRPMPADDARGEPPDAPPAVGGGPRAWPRSPRSWTWPRRCPQVQGRPVKKLPALRGRTVVNLFFEDSTRTRSSFELAGKWLSADVINISAKGSSVSKGESLRDTVLDRGRDGRGRAGHPAPRLRRAVAGRRALGRRRTSSTPATAPTSTRPRRCWTPSPCAGTSGCTEPDRTDFAGRDGRHRRRHHPLPGGPQQRAAAAHPRAPR